MESGYFANRIYAACAMALLPRLARALNKPGIATALGLILVVVAIIGMVTGDIRTRWAIIILVIGAINVLRAIPTRAG
jgi:hypothetical protein